MPPPPVHILLNRQLAMQSSRLSQLGHKIQPHVILELENVEWDLSSVSYSWGGGVMSEGLRSMARREAQKSCISHFTYFLDVVICDEPE